MRRPTAVVLAALAEATMRTVDDYKKHAEECRKLATTVTSPRDKTILENMARSWKMLTQLGKHDLEPATAD